MNLDRYLDLFAHRRDVFAEQQPDGAYFPVHRELTADDVEEHLAGLSSYGTYVIDPADQTCRYIVWDLDIHDEKALDTLQTLVEGMIDSLGRVVGIDYSMLMCEFSGNKGYHVWLFLDEPVPAEKLRRWVSADFMPKWVEAAEENGWPTALEVFPKQDSVMEGGFGNLVKLPFGVHRVSGARSEAVATHDHWWAQDVDGIRPLGAANVPDREAVTPQRLTRRGGTGSSGPHSPFACVDHIRNDGVGEGCRDKAMFHLALYYYGHGIDQDLALELCQRANENFDPPLSDGEVQAKVASAYRGAYESARCGTDWLADICPGPCQSGWRVARSAETETGVLLRAQPGSPIEVEVTAVTEERDRRRIQVTHPDAENAPSFVVRRR